MLKPTGGEAVTQTHQSNGAGGADTHPEPGRAFRAERTVWPETEEAKRSDEASVLAPWVTERVEPPGTKAGKARSTP